MINLPGLPIKYPFSPPKEGEDVLWRCQDKSYSVVIDAEAERYGSRSDIEMVWFPVLRRTEHGAWIGGGPWKSTWATPDKRFVKLTATERFACNTQLEALTSFQARKLKEKQIYEARAKAAGALLERIKDARLWQALEGK